MSSRINHVSVNARDLQESVDFYVDLRPQDDEEMSARLFVPE